MGLQLKNFTIHAFNRDVNQSADAAGQYEAWHAYRAQVSAFILEAFKEHARVGTVLVTGAGNLNDLDVAALCEDCDILTLSDADRAGMQEGLIRQKLPPALRGKIKLLPADYTGAAASGFFTQLERRAARGDTAAAMAEYIRIALAALAAENAAIFDWQYDAVISCPVYTQLLYTQIEVFLKILFEAGLYPYEDLNRILNAAYGAMPGILARYNDALLRACKPDGLLVMLSDLVEMETGGDAYRAASHMAEAGFADREAAQALAEEYGLELAWEGLWDLRTKTRGVRSRWVFWPFDASKAYLVRVDIVQPHPGETKP